MCVCDLHPLAPHGSHPGYFVCCMCVSAILGMCIMRERELVAPTAGKNHVYVVVFCVWVCKVGSVTLTIGRLLDQDVETHVCVCVCVCICVCVCVLCVW